MKRTALLAIALGVLTQGVALAARDAATRCEAAKLRAAGQKAQAVLGCWADAARTHVVDGSCLARAAERFSERWGKIQARGGCVSMEDAATAEARIDDFVADFVASVRTTTSSTNMVPTTTTFMPGATSTTFTNTTIVCVTTTGAFTQCGHMCGASGRCPVGTCSEASEGCTCVGGEPVPCGDGRLGVYCGYGTCPDGFFCGTPPECQGGPGLPCTCQPK